MIAQVRRALGCMSLVLLVGCTRRAEVGSDPPLDGGSTCASAAPFPLYYWAARSEDTTAFRRMFSNRWLLVAIASSVALQIAVVHVEFLNVAFGTAPLEPEQWIVCAGMASTVLWGDELRKWIVRRVRSRAPSAQRNVAG